VRAVDVARSGGATSALLVVLVGGLAYAGSLSAPFFFDDNNAILDNRHVRQLLPPSTSLDAPDQSSISGRPLVSLSLAVNYALGGYEVLGYHLFNLAAHLVNALLLLGILRRTAACPAGLATAAAAAWTVHPPASEAVVYVTQRTELMVATFILLTLWAAVRGWAAPGSGRRWHVLACVAATAATLCKEVAVAAPPIVLLYDRAFVSGSFGRVLRRHRGLYGGLAVSWVVLAAIVASGPRSGTVGFGYGVSAIDYLLTQGGVILLYLRLALWPVGLSISHHQPIVSDLGSALPAVLAVAALLGGSLWALRRAPWLGLAGLAFFALLAPTSSFVPIVTEVAAERRMYLPLAVVVLVVLTAGRALLRRTLPSSAAARTGLAASTVLVVGLLLLTRDRVADYESRLSIWSDAATKQPDDPTAHANLGKAREDLGRHDEAARAYERAIALDPDAAVAHNNLGRLLAMDGELDAAEEHLRRAVAVDPNQASAWNNLGNLAALAGRWQDAEEAYRKSLEVRPDGYTAHVNLAGALEHLGRAEEALEHRRAAVALEPGEPRAHYELGRSWLALDDPDRALAAFLEAQRLAPDDDGIRGAVDEARRRAR